MWPKLIDWLVPWLMRRLLKIAAKRWGKVDGFQHGVLSGRYLYRHATLPLQDWFRVSENTLDDKGIAYLNGLGTTALYDGRARRMIVEIRQACAEGKPAEATLICDRLTRGLGLDIHSGATGGAERWQIC